MKIFALQTDIQKVKAQFVSDGEKEVLFTRYHTLSFLFSSLREIMITAVLFSVAATAVYFRAPLALTAGITGGIWFVFVFFNLLKAYIDLLYDFILVTTDKVVLCDQTSIFHHKINPIHLENIGSVSAESQFWNIFPFGIIAINLKEGEGGHRIILKYVPNASEVAARISDVVTYYQRYVDGTTGENAGRYVGQQHVVRQQTTMAPQGSVQRQPEPQSTNASVAPPPVQQSTPQEAVHPMQPVSAQQSRTL